MTEEALEACPFCGNADVRFDDDLGSVSVECNDVDCWGSGPIAETPEEAARLWNTRTALAGEGAADEIAHQMYSALRNVSRALGGRVHSQPALSALAEAQEAAEAYEAANLPPPPKEEPDE